MDERELLFVIQIQEELKGKLNNLKPATKSVKFQERLKTMFLHQRAKPADQKHRKQNPQKINMRVANKRQKSHLLDQN